MAKMDELYNAIYEYCEKNNCWTDSNSATDWNQILGANYGSACYTALVNHGKLHRFKFNHRAAYYYQLAPIGKIKEKIEAKELEDNIRNANIFIEKYEEKIKQYKDYYDGQIADLESILEARLLDLEKQYKEALELLGK